MNFLDYALIVLFVLSCLAGLFRGLLREVIALVTWIVAVWVAWEYAPLLEPHLGGALAQGDVRPWAARVVIFFGVLLIGTAIGVVTSHFVRLSIFTGLDRFLGCIFGLLRGWVILGLFVILCQALRLEAQPWYHDSTLVPYGEHVANVLRSMVGERKINGRVAALDVTD